MIRYSVAPALLCLALVLPAIAEGSIGDDEHRYEAPPLLGCDESLQLGLHVSDGSCLLISGRLQSAMGYDSSAGFVSLNIELLRLVAVQESDIGPAFAVATLMNRGWWSLDGTATVPDEMQFQEAYVAIGDTTRLTAGKVTSVLDMDDDEPLDWLGERYGEEVDWAFPVWIRSYQYPMTSAAIQLTTILVDGVTGALALEEIDDQRPYGPHGGRLVASLAYENDSTSAHISWAGFGVLTGQLDGWGTHFGIASDQGNVQATIAGSVDSSNHWEALASGALDIGALEVAASVGAEADNGYSASMSVAFDPAEQLTLRLGGRAFVYPSEVEWSRHLAAEAIFRASDTLAASAELGFVDDSWMPLAYGAVGLDWHPGGGIKAKAKATFTSDSAYKVESELIRSFD